MTIQLIPYAQYGNSLSFYGNIQYAAAPDYLKTYGAWPYNPEPGMVDNIPIEAIVEVRIEPVVDIATNIALIKRLKAEIAAEEDLAARNRLRLQMDAARRAKEDAFKLAARIDEEESTFLLLH